MFFSPKLYARFSTMYSARSSVGTKRNAIALNTPATPSSTPANIAAPLTDTLPAAIGRLHFVGCLRSFSRSHISLMMYTAEDTMQTA